jgi:hypothetical protein
MIDPERATKALVAVWELEDTDTSCDLCARNAKFAVYIEGRDFYCCVSHTAYALEARSRALRHRAPVAQS